MLQAVPALHQHISLTPDKLLVGDEVVVIVDDDPHIREPIRLYFEHFGLAVLEAGSAGELFGLLSSRHVALILLDIGLPDRDGLSILPEVVEHHPDVGIVMLTGVADLQIAVECIRTGADDYLHKPVQMQEVFFVARKVLEKRRLVFENRLYQQELEKANFRIRLLHQLSMQMNTVYLSTVELDEILRAILVGITAEQGLRFNRAFLALFEEEGRLLRGRLAIGSACREEAGRVWSELQQKGMGFMDIIKDVHDTCEIGDTAVNRLVRRLAVSIEDEEHVLVRAARQRRSILVVDGRAEEGVVPRELLELLDEGSFVVVPLYSPSRSLGVIIADHFVTGKPISRRHVASLELFASQASLAIEHSHLYVAMEKKIAELQAVTLELERNKDLLVEADRFAALGQMAAQMVHVIKNPITTIGGMGRILERKLADSELKKYAETIARYSVRVESTLGDLFDFVASLEQPDKARGPLYPLVRQTVMLLQPAMSKQGIRLELDLVEPEPLVDMDEGQIRQVLVHLLRNGVEAMPRGGTLSVQARVDGDLVRLDIADTGEGMSANGFAHARDPFYTTKTYGTGMGLSLVEKIVQSHAGFFRLENRGQAGMTAHVVLPLAVE